MIGVNVSGMGKPWVNLIPGEKMTISCCYSHSIHYVLPNIIHENTVGIVMKSIVLLITNCQGSISYFVAWFKHILFMTEHDKGLGRPI